MQIMTEDNNKTVLANVEAGDLRSNVLSWSPDTSMAEEETIIAQLAQNFAQGQEYVEQFMMSLNQDQLIKMLRLLEKNKLGILLHRMQIEKNGETGMYLPNAVSYTFLQAMINIHMVNDNAKLEVFAEKWAESIARDAEKVESARKFSEAAGDAQERWGWGTPGDLGGGDAGWNEALGGKKAPTVDLITNGIDISILVQTEQLEEVFKLLYMCNYVQMPGVWPQVNSPDQIKQWIEQLGKDTDPDGQMHSKWNTFNLFSILITAIASSFSKPFTDLYTITLKHLILWTNSTFVVAKYALDEAIQLYNVGGNLNMALLQHSYNAAFFGLGNYLNQGVFTYPQLTFWVQQAEKNATVITANQQPWRPVQGPAGEKAVYNFFMDVPQHGGSVRRVRKSQRTRYRHRHRHKRTKPRHRHKRTRHRHKRTRHRHKRTRHRRTRHR